ncbi:nuclear fragile X mental retardation-interacting protein 1 [Homalodisca vitripennis]|uniref:nuclear fragile X mental retardation-interacting protein 1 n=1 Tax=Homalodisca vitripennis TaxID=197043 RepID=UPI001EE9CF85|nr:nuclear fragile X mental retardation-interacting protein 1 [Homalodisca vitripennis]
MVRLFRGGRGGRGAPRPPFSYPLPPRPPRDFEPNFRLPFGAPRGRLLRGNLRPGPPHPRLPPPPRMAPSPLPPPPPRPLPLPPHQPLNHRDLRMPGPIPRRPHPMNRPGMPPPMHPHPLPPPGSPLRRPLRPGPPGPPPFMRGRGGLARRGVGLKRLGTNTPANGRNKKVSKRKEKKEGDFYCETCDRSWKTQEMLEEHVSQHEVCGRDGCTFTGHPKVVQKHVELQHDTGLYQRIVADNPDDIAKWIAERKRRFPTKENVQKKEAQQDEMMNRGERIPTQGKRFQNRPTWNNRGRNTNNNAGGFSRGGAQRQSRPRPEKLMETSDSSKWRDPDAWRGDLPKFPGTAAIASPEEEKHKNLVDNSNFSDDEDWTMKGEETPNAINTEKPLVSNVLLSLMTSYGSDMSDGDDEVMTQESTRTESTTLVKDIGETTDFIANQNGDDNPKLRSEAEDAASAANVGEESDSGPEETGIDREDKSNIPFPDKLDKEDKTELDKTQSTEARKLDVRPKAPHARPMRRHQLSLLEKLLSNEIRKERNAILQCVRYVVNNNFFGCANLPKAANGH